MLKDSPAFFDASRYRVSQHFATSKDGTRVPYFEIAAKRPAGQRQEPDAALRATAASRSRCSPSYSGGIGRAWLDKGGVYVVANIRGGGEYGPRWHQAALQENRLRTYEDFAAVSEDLFARKITSPGHLGAMGGSNGGLLMGNMLTLYPKLYGAVVSEVALLDMRRYTHLSAGASWIAEYGDPDQPDEWEFIQTFSPYENAKPGTHTRPPLHHLHPRRPRGPGACAQDAREDGGAGVRQQLLREHGRRPQRRNGQQGIRFHGRTGLRVPVATPGEAVMSNVSSTPVTLELIGAPTDIGASVRGAGHGARRAARCGPARGTGAARATQSSTAATSRARPRPGRRRPTGCATSTK